MMTTTLTTIDRTAITLLVAARKKRFSGAVSQSYPIDLADSAAQIDKSLHAVAWLEETTLDNLVIVGIEFADPEQHNTTVTLTGPELIAVTWVSRDGGPLFSMVGEIPGFVEEVVSASVPVYVESDASTAHHPTW